MIGDSYTDITLISHLWLTREFDLVLQVVWDLSLGLAHWGTRAHINYLTG